MFDSGNTRSYDFRIHQLKELESAIRDNEEEISLALYKDLHKARFESYTAEIGFIYEEINYTIKKLKYWTRPKRLKEKPWRKPSSNVIRS